MFCGLMSQCTKPANGAPERPRAGTTHQHHVAGDPVHGGGAMRSTKSPNGQNYEASFVRGAGGRMRERCCTKARPRREPQPCGARSSVCRGAIITAHVVQMHKRLQQLIRNAQELQVRQPAALPLREGGEVELAALQHEAAVARRVRVRLLRVGRHAILKLRRARARAPRVHPDSIQEPSAAHRTAAEATGFCRCGARGCALAARAARAECLARAKTRNTAHARG
jgi:hypothetical protein